MLFGAVFTERDAISLKAEYHEETHCNQYHTMFCFGMFISLLTIRQFADIILLNLLLILYDDVFFSKDSYFR